MREMDLDLKIYNLWIQKEMIIKIINKANKMITTTLMINNIMRTEKRATIVILIKVKVIIAIAHPKATIASVNMTHILANKRRMSVMITQVMIAMEMLSMAKINGATIKIMFGMKLMHLIFYG